MRPRGFGCAIDCLWVCKGFGIPPNCDELTDPGCGLIPAEDMREGEKGLLVALRGLLADEDGATGGEGASPG
jgi:hypothetical protein